MKAIVVVPAAALAAWILTPVIDIVVRGTIDARSRAAVRAESPPAPAPDINLPDPRPSAENEPTVTAPPRT